MLGIIESERFDTECLSTTFGENYDGEVSSTVSGTQCQHWSEQWPHPHSYDDAKYFTDSSTDPNVKLDEIANFCRNPIMSDSVDAQPWCYTTNENVVKEFCDIPRCKCKTLAFVQSCWSQPVISLTECKGRLCCRGIQSIRQSIFSRMLSYTFGYCHFHNIYIVRHRLRIAASSNWLQIRQLIFISQ